jgi:RHS repeat-associated protein
VCLTKFMGCKKLAYYDLENTAFLRVVKCAEHKNFGVNWYDYGARMYDPALGRFMTVDPLAEWHFNATPYHYCFNNPINLIDPFGMDTLPVNPDTWIPDGGMLPEATATAESKVSLWERFKKWATSGGSIPGGDHYTTNGPVGSPTRMKSTNPNDVVITNVDDLLLAASKATPGPMSTKNTNPGARLAKGVSSGVKAVEKATSDKEIIEESTGSSPVMDKSGNIITTVTLKNGDQISTRQGNESYVKGDTIVSDSDSAPGSPTYWQIKNAERGKYVE